MFKELDVYKRQPLHLHPINVVVYNDPQKSNLVAGFVLRCFQHLSDPEMCIRDRSFMKATIASLIFLLLSLAVSSQTYKYIGIEEGLSNQKVLVLLTDMTSYADALAIVSNRMDQIPSKDSMPGSLYRCV